ncbi:MAG: isoprenylcysteine carboxylmethyltransferase family protein [Chitinophagaceae bacterium]|nr:MAG: isoprenylcysteine carboxylmethyltransferase family protein [Chitinophagaceae bacterium]
MKIHPTHAAVYIPPPVIGILIFLLSIGIQKYFPIGHHLFHSTILIITGWLFIIIALSFGMSGIFRFLRTNNTVETFKAASSLQTTGIYTISRNPMYVGLVCLYTGLSLLIGNWWTVIFIAVFIFILQEYVIRREERYLRYAFGEQYISYTRRVRRWIGRKKKASR